MSRRKEEIEEENISSEELDEFDETILSGHGEKTRMARLLTKKQLEGKVTNKDERRWRCSSKICNEQVVKNGEISYESYEDQR